MVETRIYKARVTLDIVVQAKDPAEAAIAVDRHTFIDGVSREVGEIVEVRDVSELPPGWDGGELAFSAWEIQIQTERSIRSWLALLAPTASP